MSEMLMKNAIKLREFLCVEHIYVLTCVLVIVYKVLRVSKVRCNPIFMTDQYIYIG